MYGQFAKDLNTKTETEDRWLRMRSDLTIETEAVLCAAQEESLTNKYVKRGIDNTTDTTNAACVSRRVRAVCVCEAAWHSVSERPKLARHEYKRCNDNATRIIY